MGNYIQGEVFSQEKGRSMHGVVSLAGFFAAFFLISAFTLFAWQRAGVNTVTGDEPHYLLMANGIVKYRTFEQTSAYREEFKTRSIYQYGLAPQDAEPDGTNTHALPGVHGLYNVHGIGLPLLLAGPFAAGGVLGAKLFLLLITSMLVIMLWRYSGLIGLSERKSLLIVAPIVFSVPFIPAAAQVYPELTASAILVAGFVWLIGVREKQPGYSDFWISGLLAFLPWLQIKFSVASFVVIVAVICRFWAGRANFTRILAILILPAISCCLLGLYNYYAFGKISGPYQDGAIEFSKTSLMVFLGLHLDQNQGFLFLNPILFFGLVGLGAFYRFDKYAFWVWLIVYLSIMVPNALHPNWYGGGSFSGRFGWAGTALFALPTMFALSKFYESGRYRYFTVLAVVFLIQLYFFKKYAVKGVSLYNKGAETWSSSYSIFYGRLYDYLPMLYNSKWAYSYVQNYTWLILSVLLVLLGFIGKKISRGAVFAAVLLAVFAVFAGHVWSRPGNNSIEFSASSLPGKVGQFEQGKRIAVAGRDSEGFLTYGPYFALSKGSYKVEINYSGSVSSDVELGWADVFNASRSERLQAHVINGTSELAGKIVLAFEVKKRDPELFEFRSFWNGQHDLSVSSIRLEETD